MRTLALVDGEHYPPVTRWGIEVARERGYDVIAAVLVGGIEKLGAGETPDLGVPTRAAGDDRFASVAAAIDELTPDVVLDLSDEPILGYRERMAVAAIALARGVPYVGPDFRLDPPERLAPPLGTPTLAVFGTGKRTGKTAVAGEVARIAARGGLLPVVVAMGRGGPPEPQVAEAGSVTLDSLIALARDGQHAASDYLEDALTTGVTTIGARRAGGGLAGAPFSTNVAEALELAAARDPGVVILEGSGAALPPIAWDAGVDRRPGDLSGRIRARLPRSLPALAGGSGRGYHGRRTGSRNGERLPPHRASPRFPRRCSGRGYGPSADAAGRRRRTKSLLRDHRATGGRRPTGRTPGDRARRGDRRVVGAAR